MRNQPWAAHGSTSQLLRAGKGDLCAVPRFFCIDNLKQAFNSCMHGICACNLEIEYPIITRLCPRQMIFQSIGKFSQKLWHTHACVNAQWATSFPQLQGTECFDLVLNCWAEYVSKLFAGEYFRASAPQDEDLFLLAFAKTPGLHTILPQNCTSARVFHHGSSDQVMRFDIFGVCRRVVVVSFIRHGASLFQVGFSICHLSRNFSRRD